MVERLLESSASWSNFFIFFGLAVLLLFAVLGFVTYGILAERKVMGFMQGRVGPNQVGGRFGLLQTVADVLKLLLKEDSIPKAADKPLFILAPIIAFAPAFMVLAVIPFTSQFQFADIGVGLLYYIAISGITTIGVLTGGWASNNKYSLLGGMRAAAQMISYEIPLVMSVIGIVLLTGSLNLNEIVASQEKVWYIFAQPIGFIIFLIAAVAELNRTPFDLPEAESELVSGYHTEYSGFRWAFFMLAEYVYLFGMASLMTVLFLGGWNPVLFLDFIPGAVWFALKFSAVVFLFIWFRVTFPRMRGDQLMEFGWKVLLPIALANIFLTALIKELFF
ncbi:NADH-quinone oxidoreductase subunit NuoH [Bacillus cytotoxicus]|uniref:NADH-quinone oxidoreductase subunit H n=1 Tax=Bacillus cytotoxicus (strain DSM 22905 / CIP 110041 / 391-98 / NVH 391-98) TaxID=315749 RepID=NUOH_BACCN|nr:MULTISPECIES: NADH-quinone oxidoreductase subunit NuoH [Bacillus cereus group]A7GV47.1 RecName: Full=NADH-quinone oxidoreductase subunit H; AltName: Full=NADH dehydrogenase I subunit H; AltName: Full=NDH-1 subunit H [Bacillus cytotoxicus NVH 391-98]ABS24005.1 NADH dehydrogenase (quinone) [Bacillus cytotoxicus NVH 391-98]AWC46604.1 NADH-quinone oxidoreductase subunit H [Bacillus cytotoxicus]AWC62848.1 NADH-quinone oxidoreductase subunit H [Bacillus cytotoxicus]KMT49650.1 NADH:ubiquinone oxid